MGKLIIKFKKLKDFYDSWQYYKQDYSDLDLSNLDLSEIPSSKWSYASFFNVNLSNSKINFRTEDGESWWKPASLYKCNLTNCDLSYLQDGWLDDVDISGANFKNTKLHIKITPIDYRGKIKDLRGTYLGEEYTEDELRELLWCFDLDTMKLYPKMKLSSSDLLKLIHIPLYTRNRYPNVKEHFSFYDRDHDYEKFKSDLKRVQKLDRENDNKLEKLYEKLVSLSKNPDSFNQNDKELFYLGYVFSHEFGDIDFTEFDEEIIRNIRFYFCDFDNVHFKSIRNLTNQFRDLYTESNFKSVTFDDLTPSFWMENRSSRFNESHMTFRTSAYVELDRACDARCEFCRNRFLPSCKYDIDKIIDTIMRYPKINNIVIGGGEPTLRLDDLKKLILNVSSVVDGITVFSNGEDMDSLLEIDELNRVGFNISRHSIDDDINNEIFGINVMNKRELIELVDRLHRFITLCCTCFKGDGVDSIKKIKDYINFAEEVRAKNILFQTLHEDLESPNSVEPVSPKLFDFMIDFLRKDGWDISKPIYSTGDYKLIVASRRGNYYLKTISFKKYITEEELKNEWYKATKRTFDLSIDPSGNLYQNWHQSYGKVLRNPQHK